MFQWGWSFSDLNLAARGVFFSQKAYRKYEIHQLTRVLSGDQLLIQSYVVEYSFLRGNFVPVKKRCFPLFWGLVSFFYDLSFGAILTNHIQIFRPPLRDRIDFWTSPNFLFNLLKESWWKKGGRTLMIGMWSSMILFPQTKNFKKNIEAVEPQSLSAHVDQWRIYNFRRLLQS